MWNKEQIKDHIDTAALLHQIIIESLDFIKQKKYIATEFEVCNFVLNQFKKNDLVSDKERPIVAFGKNTSFVHYYPDANSSKTLAKNDLIMIDIWARKNKKGSPYADITWMAFCGSEVPASIKTIFNHVITARDKAIVYLEEQLRTNVIPDGRKVDSVPREYFSKYGLSDNFLHSTGHSIGHRLSPHGRYGHIKKSNKKSLTENLGYTIEPGLYFKNQFGIRSEIDFIVIDNEVKITTLVQKKITIID